MADAVATLRSTWNEVVGAFLDGKKYRPPPLDRWFSSYTGEVNERGFRKPWIGPLDRRPAMAFLGLNPGRVVPHLQAPDGLFADEIRELGSFSA